ncbi:hypothetical protein N9A89_01410 [Akkermansiaceae bacterium]|nr:hypothetical protein [Akkermansiaceae bacterium]MDA7933308.1 hypothetical protein [bacterium]MDA7538136.1 hypothetical protein [Akkermansiaceae bacterium]MDA7672534.1 hypothetical protein [Akkermansiaceae bacterium]MDA7862209.1 hypothetical protein [Akkermansiaceae bacterium]
MHFLPLLALAAALGLASCSSYQADFKKEAKKFKQGDSPKGPWKGTWKSEFNGHHGPIWCLVSQDPKQPENWTFRYRAGWGVLQFGDYGHPIKLALRPGNVLLVDDKMTLSNDFGTYAVKGKVTPTKFNFRFNGSGDKGTMILTRPKKNP